MDRCSNWQQLNNVQFSFDEYCSRYVNIASINDFLSKLTVILLLLLLWQMATCKIGKSVIHTFFEIIFFIHILPFSWLLLLNFPFAHFIAFCSKSSIRKQIEHSTHNSFENFHINISLDWIEFSWLMAIAFQYIFFSVAGFSYGLLLLCIAWNGWHGLQHYLLFSMQIFIL